MYDTLHFSSATFSANNIPLIPAHHYNLPPPNISNICSKTATICCHFATDHIPGYIHFTIYHHQLHLQCSEAQAISAISPKT